ncbi:AAA domain (Cdc48 subfamily) [Paenimyroides aquimaris]|uniref:AAA domain (Cdc48 subfamily) n=1 Tax=Paenimyroides marinum TaxID=1159016 RepID=A0A1H6MNK1_9FLAO|nr:AAA family ATPase [Paenimyroides aquimaris]SEI03413.1 AAA domain (Cdc48 subfamily) [Paenimyroides aquimaris]
MDKVLLFYEKDDYYDFKDSKTLEGYSIISVTKLIHNLSLIKEFDTNSEIIDLSALTEYNSIQSIFEQMIYQFEETPIFICDVSKREKLEYELRFIFDEFQNVDRETFVKKEKETELLNNEKQLVSKRHKKIIDLNDDELSQFFSEFRNRLYGHSKFKDDFEQQIRTFRVFNKLGEHKILSLFLMGESGVGKTEVARTIFNCLKGEKKLAKINFGNYSNEFSLSSLIGSARGYIGSDDGEIFMKVRETDMGILLIDEFEKSNSTLFNYFLEVLESGKMTSSLGEEMDLNGFIIVFTSNISKEDFKKRISPELRSRFDYKCIFTLLSDNDKMKYIEFRAESISKKVKSEFKIDLGEQLKAYLSTCINVSSYKNMRDINKQIKKEFLTYLSIYQSNQDENIEIQNNTTKVGFTRKLLNILNG